MAPVVAGRVRRALEVIPADKLILSTDCGFGRQGFNRTVAFYKTTAIAQGAEHRAAGSSASRSATCRRPTRRCRRTCCPTTSR